MVRDNRYRRMARRCGYWAAASHMRKRGYPVDEAIRRLLGVHPVPLLTDVAHLPWHRRVMERIFVWYTWSRPE